MKENIVIFVGQLDAAAPQSTFQPLGAIPYSTAGDVSSDNPQTKLIRNWPAFFCLSFSFRLIGVNNFLLTLFKDCITTNKKLNRRRTKTAMQFYNLVLLALGAELAAARALGVDKVDGGVGCSSDKACSRHVS